MTQAYADFDALNQAEIKLQLMACRYSHTTPIMFDDAIAEIKDCKKAVGRVAIDMTNGAINDLMAAEASIKLALKD